MDSERDAYDELSCYTLGHGDPAFIHQHVVDAFAAQHADQRSKPIGVAFALIGLYLHVERGFSGRQVQRVHMQLGRRKRDWPEFALPTPRGTMTAIDVIRLPMGPARDRAIDEWCRSVWMSCSGSRHVVVDLLQEYGIV